MKSFNTLMLPLLFCCCRIFAQEIITEVNYSAGAPKAFHHQTQTLKDNYELGVSDGVTQIYFKKPDVNSLPQSGAKQVDETYTLQINLNYPPGTYAPSFVVVFKEEENSQNQLAGENNTVTFDVTPGVYDVLVQALKLSDRKASFVFKELITVNEDMVVNIDLTEADNLITTKFLDYDGSDLAPGIVDPNTGEITGGSANVYATTYVYYKSKNWTPFVGYYLWENSEGVQNEVWNYYVSDVSDRYAFIHTNLGLGYNGEGYVSKYETLDEGITTSQTLQNDPNDWVMHQQAFQPSVVGEEQGEFYYGFSNWDLYNEYGLSGWIGKLFPDPIQISNPLKVHLNNADDENPADMMVNLVLEDYFGTFDETMGDESFFITGNPIMLDENRNVIYGGSTFLSGYYFTGYIYNANEDGVKLLPFHPRFSFNAENNPVIFGDNVPISITSYDGNYVKASYIGRNGEGRESDIMDLQVNVKKDGVTTYEGNYANFIFADPISTGNIEVNIINSNVVVDGIEGITNTTLSFNAESAEDNIPPTLQMLQFRNGAGQVTDRFSSDEEGFVRLAAGDFEYVSETRSLNYIPGNSVQFLYKSNNGQDDWIALPLTNYPEHLFPLAYGDYYEASLSSIDNQENDTWYDVKIICTDPAGNKQEQVISPAFKLNDTMGVTESYQFDFAIYPNPFSNELNISPKNLKGNFTFKISDLNGKTIYSEDKNSNEDFIWNGASLPKGVYILSIRNNGKTIAKKIIKK